MVNSHQADQAGGTLQCQTAESESQKSNLGNKIPIPLAVSLAILAKRNTPFLCHKIKGMQRPLGPMITPGALRPTSAKAVSARRHTSPIGLETERRNTRRLLRPTAIRTPDHAP